MLSQHTQQQPSSNLSEHNLSQIFDVMPSGLVLLDNKGYVSRANPVAKQLLGDDIEQQRWLEAVPRLFAPKADDGHELSLVDGRRVQLSLSPLQDRQGQLIVLTDMTHTRQLQANVAKLQRLSALGKMVASLAHQIRTPLSAAMLYGSNLANKTLSDKARENFQGKMMARLNDLETQVNDMLLFAKSGEKMVVSDVSVEQIIDCLQAATEACMRRYQVNFKRVLKLPNTTLLVNANALVSALSNLVENAAQQSAPNSDILVSTAYCDGALQIAIEDQAGGIKEADPNRIFEPFYTTKQNGTGLGLAVVKSVVNAHQGEIRVEAAEQGARFVVDLPLPDVCQQNLAVGGH
ncbi:sensor histidine kinase [Agarivorans gilvus]|uniref:histidine kinase n=1 Tax=Agarivorans gilvus TaxID=680279 RepID=A0ABQ1I3V1_9ALTE|nr:ATP-binding protein [Agarivorans gilvus]GGB10439.1 sensor histidine kinase [Agarivorans gilvus]